MLGGGRTSTSGPLSHRSSRRHLLLHAGGARARSTLGLPVILLSAVTCQRKPSTNRGKPKRTILTSLRVSKHDGSVCAARQLEQL